jgi:hypothetical protein
MKGVFLMELIEEDDPDPGRRLGYIITCSDRPTSSELRALVNLGPTHTFILDAVVHRLRLQITHQPSLSVKVANEHHLQSYDTTAIQGEMFRMES